MVPSVAMEKIPSDTNGDRSRDFPTNSAVYFFKIDFNIISHLCQGLPSHHFPSGFPTKTFYVLLLPPMLAIRTTHLMLLT